MITILLIEDDKFLRELVVKKLSPEGFNILEAIDGESGLAIMREKKPQLLLLDLILPGTIDGFEILRRIQADKALSAIPVVVLSNLGQQEEIDLALKLGAKFFLVKAHSTPAEILAKIKEMLNIPFPR